MTRLFMSNLCEACPYSTCDINLCIKYFIGSLPSYILGFSDAYTGRRREESSQTLGQMSIMKQGAQITAPKLDFNSLVNLALWIRTTFDER